jgi:hypothetical protein
MKIKLAILDTLPEREPQLLTPGDYFTWSGKLHRWQYSPEECQKQIYTDFT